MEKNAVNPELAEFVRARSGIRPHRVANAIGRIQTRRPSEEWPVKPGEEESEVPDGFESQKSMGAGTSVPQQDGVPAEKLGAMSRRYSVGGHNYVVSHEGYGKRDAPVITVRRDGRIITDGIDRVADHLAEGMAAHARRVKTAAVDLYESWAQENVHEPKSNCFFYAGAMAALFPELKLYKGQHSGQHRDDTGHFYLKAPDGRIIDPTAKQFRTGKLVDPGHEVSAQANLDHITNHALFETLSEEDQKRIRGMKKEGASRPPADLLDVPVVRQDKSGCGAAATEAVLAFFGIDRRGDQISTSLGTSAAGTDPEQILNYLNRAGLAVSAESMLSVEDLRRYINAKQPVIVLLQAYGSGNYETNRNGHYAVVVGVAPDRVYFMDPSSRDYTFLPVAEFEKRWHDRTAEGKELVRYGIVSRGNPHRVGVVKMAAGEREFLARVRDEAKKKGYEIFAVAGPPGEGGASVYHSRGPKEESAAWNARRAHIEWEKERGIDPQHDWSKTAAEFAPGIPEDKRIHPIPRIEAADKNAQWDVVFSKHPAERRGDHIDVRLVDHHGKAHSWAVPPELPAPGKSVYAVQQPTHTGEYALRAKPFEITEGYGKTRPGAQIEPMHIGKAEVVEANDDKIRFLSHGRTTTEYVLRRIGSAGTEHPIWAFHNATKTRETGEGKKIPDYKPSYVVSKPEKIDFDDPTKVLTAKIDGAHTITYFPGDDKHLRVFSYRTSASDPARLIEHTHKIPDFQKHVGNEFKNTVLRTEMWFSGKDGKAVPVETTGGLLNASTLKSRQRQEELGLTPRLTVIDVVRHDGKKFEDKPYADKLDVMKKVVAAVPLLELPPMATTPEQKRDLFKKVQSGELPHTHEGVVQHDLESPGYTKAVFRPTSDVYVTGIFKKPRGEARGHAGGFEYSTTPGGDTAGRVGTGFDHATRKDMMENPEKYIGRVARVESMKYSGGTLRTPAFKGWHIDKTDPELLKEANMLGAGTHAGVDAFAHIRYFHTGATATCVPTCLAALNPQQ